MKIELSSSDKRSLFWHRTGKLIIIAFSLTAIFLYNSIYLNNQKGLKFEYRTLSETEAYISWSKELALESGNKAMWKYEFIYKVDSIQYVSSSIATDQQLNFEDYVQIEYLKSDPKISRIKGTESAALWPFKVTLVLLFVSLLGSWLKYRSLGKVNFIMNDMACTVSSLSETLMTVRGLGSSHGDYLYRFRYTYTVKGQNYMAYLTTYDLEQKDKKQEIIYAQCDPSKSVVMCALPKAVIIKIKMELNSL